MDFLRDLTLKRFFMMPNLPSLPAPEIVVTTTPSATNDDNIGTRQLSCLNEGYCCLHPGGAKQNVISTWWRHQMETFSALLAICAGNSPVSGEFPAQRPVTRSFDVFFDVRLIKRLSKHSRGWWFGTLSHPLWRHRNDPWYFETSGVFLKWTYFWEPLTEQHFLNTLNYCNQFHHIVRWNMFFEC